MTVAFSAPLIGVLQIAGPSVNPTAPPPANSLVSPTKLDLAHLRVDEPLTMCGKFRPTNWLISQLTHSCGKNSELAGSSPIDFDAGGIPRSN